MKFKKAATVLTFLSLLSSCDFFVPEYEGKLLKKPDVQFNVFERSKVNQGYLDFCTKLSTFSADLSGKYFKNGNKISENISISPLSIYMALSLATECTNNNTRQELLNVLGCNDQSAPMERYEEDG